MGDVNSVVAISYIVIQVTIAVIVSILGAIHVRQCEIEAQKQQSTQNPIDTKHDKQLEIHIDSNNLEEENKEIETDKKYEEKAESVPPCKRCLKFMKLWAKTMWKMKSIYSSLAVHCFDVLTDVLVIIQWMNTPNISGDHIDPQIMAYSAIFIILFSKVFSTFAIYIKERSILRAILQFLDILIFQEIYEAHTKIKTQIKAKSMKDKNNAIESTLSFKYIRQMEAVFESVPESVLQLVFILRLPTAAEPIFIISILQSIVSMGNSVINHDYTMMQEEKWKKYKEKFPPTIQFFKHAIVRISEITYRIGLLSLIWTVCGGMIFSIIIGVEFLIIILRTVSLIMDGVFDFNADTVILAINSLIVVPPEEMYVNIGDGLRIQLLLCCCLCLSGCSGCVFLCIGTVFAWMMNGDDLEDMLYSILIPAIRVNTSYLELVFLILWVFFHFFGENGDRKMFLLSINHGYYIFITTCICFIIYTQFPWLFPNFSLPLGVPIRSKWGYAYSNELAELKKIKLPKFPYTKTVRYRRLGYLGRWHVITHEIKIKNKQQFWDEPVRGYQNTIEFDHTGPCIFALAMGHHEIVTWLKEQGVTSTITMDEARRILNETKLNVT